MLKDISKSNVQNRSFKVYKKFYASQNDYPVLKLYDKSNPLHSGSGAFDANEFEKTISGSIYDSFHKSPMYNSIKQKYFVQNDLVKMFGSISNLYDFNDERRLEENLYVIDISQIRYGEGIKPNSIRLTDTDSSMEYYDDGKGRLVGVNTEFAWIRMDFNQFPNDFTKGADIVFSDTDTSPITARVQPAGIDFQNPNITMTWEGDTDDRVLTHLDAYTDSIKTGSEGVFETTEALNFLGSGLEPTQFGNVFYSDGLIMFTTIDSDIINYDLEFRSTKTVYELEVLCQAGQCEFNYSQNPSAVNVTLSGSYDFETTSIANLRPSGTQSIKEVLDITQVQGYTSSYDGETTGSWEDYYSNVLTDPTGSYLTTFVSTIGLYDENNNMVAVAKLPKPIKKYPDMDINFIVRIDL